MNSLENELSRTELLEILQKNICLHCVHSILAVGISLVTGEAAILRDCGCSAADQGANLCGNEDETSGYMERTDACPGLMGLLEE